MSTNAGLHSAHTTERNRRSNPRNVLSCRDRGHLPGCADLDVSSATVVAWPSPGRRSRDNGPASQDRHTPGEAPVMPRSARLSFVTLSKSKAYRSADVPPCVCGRRHVRLSPVGAHVWSSRADEMIRRMRPTRRALMIVAPAAAVGAAAGFMAVSGGGRQAGGPVRGTVEPGGGHASSSTAPGPTRTPADTSGPTRTPADTSGPTRTPADTSGPATVWRTTFVSAARHRAVSMVVIFPPGHGPPVRASPEGDPTGRATASGSSPPGGGGGPGVCVVLHGRGDDAERSITLMGLDEHLGPPCGRGCRRSRSWPSTAARPTGIAVPPAMIPNG